MKADSSGESTVARTDDVAGYEDRVVVAGADGIGVVAEDWPVHLALAGQADESDLALEQACAAGEVDGFIEGWPLGQGHAGGGDDTTADGDLTKLASQVSQA